MTTALFDLDGLDFDMVSSTASRVDPQAPTRFRYSQRGEMVWGNYFGDTVTEGHFVGQLKGNELSISFAHELVSDLSVVRGSAVSEVEDRGGKLYLVETFILDGAEHTSVCEQVRD